MATGARQRERIIRIVQLVEMRGAVSVSELSNELGTSVVTIRKDLELLEGQGKLSRVTGGAVACEKKETEPEYFLDTSNADLKHAVAQKAAELIEDGDSLLVTAGVTPHLTLRKARQRKGLKIVTESLAVAEDLCGYPGWQMMILGGEICGKYLFVHGQDAVKQAERYMADKAIITMDGVCAESGLSTIRPEGTDVLRFILARARMRILVADITKIGLQSRYYIGKIEDINILVTNRTDDSWKMKELERIEKTGVKIIYAED